MSKNLEKRRTREHVIADLGVNHVERQVLVAGYTMQRMVNDYGLDAIIRTYDRGGRVERGLIWLQIKATEHAERLRKTRAFGVRIERRDLVHWMSEQYPVILTLYDATRNRAYWLHVQNSLQHGEIFELARMGATVTMHVPMTQIVTPEVMGEFRRLKVKAQTDWKKGAKS